MYDVLIVGAGPAGISAGIAARRAGLSHLILEKGMLVHSLYRFPTQMHFFSSSRKLEIGGVPFVSHQDKPTRLEALEYYRRVAEYWQLRIKTYEPVLRRSTTPAGEHCLHTPKGSYTSRAVVVATGFYDVPRHLGISGEDLPHVKHYYDDPHPYHGQRVVVVGAANSAVDAALETWRAGAASVTMIVRGEEISPRVKYWVRPDIQNRIAEGSITALFGHRPIAITPEQVVVRGKSGERSIPCDFVLALTGYQPNYPLLDALGVPIDDDPARTPLHDPATMETPVAGLFLCGVVAGGLATNKLYIENTRDQALRIMARLVPASASRGSGVLPGVPAELRGAGRG